MKYVRIRVFTDTYSRMFFVVYIPVVTKELLNEYEVNPNYPKLSFSLVGVGNVILLPLSAT